MILISGKILFDTTRAKKTAGNKQHPSYFFVIFTGYKVTFLALDCKIILKIKVTTFLFWKYMRLSFKKV